jgi:hypothetical protein
VVEHDDRSRRSAEIHAFFDAETPQTERLKVLRKNGVDYVYMSSGLREHFLSLPDMHLELQTPAISVFRFADAESGGEGS